MFPRNRGGAGTPDGPGFVNVPRNVLAVANQLGESSGRPNRHTVRLESGQAAKAIRELLVVDPQPEEDAAIGGDDEILVAVKTCPASRECTTETTELGSSSSVEAHIERRVPPRQRHDAY
jgi:hypothetical protein